MLFVKLKRTYYLIQVLLYFILISTISAHTINLPATLVSSTESIKTVKSGINFGEGPAVDPDGNLYFSDRNPSRIWKVSVNGTATVFRNPANDANGMVFDKDGRLIVCEKKGLSRTEMDSSITKILNADTLGTEGPNDLTLTSSGGVFFTSSVWGGDGKVFYLSPQGTLKTVLSFTNPPLNYPNGIELVEEKKLLYINITQKDTIFKYYFDEQMNLSKIGALCKTPSPDGLALDVDGNLWVANTNGNHQITVFDSTGKKLGEIIVDGQESIQNCAFGGEDRKTLYITGKTTVYSLKTVVAGRSTNGVTSIIRSGQFADIRRNGSGVAYRSVIESFNCYHPYYLQFDMFNLQGVKQWSSGTVSERVNLMSSKVLLIRIAPEKGVSIPDLR
jgi:gluconolactonase